MMSFQFDHWEIDDYPKLRSPSGKTVRYSNLCSVILIPTIQEFREAGIELWDPRHRPETAQCEEYFCDSPIPTEEELKSKDEEEEQESEEEKQSHEQSDHSSPTMTESRAQKVQIRKQEMR